MATRQYIFGLLLLYFAYGVSAGTGCDDGWLLSSEYCYKLFNNKMVSRSSAQLECTTYDATLVNVKNGGSLMFLQDQFQTYPSSGYWTGFNDIPKAETATQGTGVWKWGATDIQDMNASFITWNQAPANDGLSNCAGPNMQGKLVDMPCDSRQGYICEETLSDDGCLPNWIRYGPNSNCYFVSDTRDPSLLKTWEGAKNVCADYRKDSNSIVPSLLIIDDSTEAHFLRYLIAHMAVNTKIYWTGLIYKSNAWKWYNNAQVIATNLVEWQTEPDNVAGIENCAVLRTNGKFSDRDCQSDANFICYKQRLKAAQSSSNHGCGTWTRAGQMCVSFTKKTAPWSQARAYCQSYGGDLIKIDTIDKKIWLRHMTLTPQYDRVYWTGLNDREKEGHYVWADGTPTTRTMVVWNHEPSDFKGQEDCAIIETTGQYNDIACTYRAPAICQLSGLWFCPDDTWVLNEKICYLFTPHDDPEKLFVQQEAEEYCESMSKYHGVPGGLLAVDTRSQHDYVKQQVKLASRSDNPYGWWTSLNDKEVEGVWKTRMGPVTDRSLIDWYGEPSKAIGDNCGFVNYNGVFHMRNCNINITFICEKYALGVNTVQSSQSSDSSLISSSTIAVVTSSIMYILSYITWQEL